MRSFNNMLELTHENLGNVLKTYALTNPKLNYCQGMNFLAGFLFLCMGNQEYLAFGALREVVDRYAMTHLFNKELPMLKLMFYQLDRLICIHLPDLHNHFKDESINSSFFSSSFFITLYTSIMQAQRTNKHAWKLQRVWDHFLVHGYKVLFKASLLILKTYEEELLEKNFEEMLGCLTNLPQRFLLSSCEMLRENFDHQQEKK